MIIPGWTEVVVDEDTDLMCIQMVDGHWYTPNSKSALQEVVEEWRDAMIYIYLSSKYHHSDGTPDASTSDGRMALRILKEWDVIGDDGMLID